MGVIRRSSLDRPDETRQFANGVGQIAHLGSLTIGRGLLRPGWRWSTDVAPVTGTSSCTVHHLNMLLAGRLAVRMDDGESAEFAPNDVFEIPPGHDAWVVGDESVVLLDFYGNAGAIGVPGSNDRIVTTLLMSDIVDSTATAARLGDEAWRQVLAQHNRLVRAQLDRFRGAEVKTTGDGFLATFQSAVAAVRCAGAVRDRVRAEGIEVRIGVHTGEVEVLPGDVGGLSVHAVARIMALGGRSEVIVSEVTRGLVRGSELRMGSRGVHALKGLPDEIEVFLLADDRPAP